MEKATQREHSGLGIMMKETIIMKPATKRHQYYTYIFRIIERGFLVPLNQHPPPLNKFPDIIKGRHTKQ